jgi:hypothetical protein
MMFGLAPDTHTVFIPEVFAANDDGKNDTSMITCLPGMNPDDDKMHLLNSARGKVLQMDGLLQNFDGDNLPDGVYWWVLEEVKSEKRTVQIGGLTIRRR